MRDASSEPGSAPTVPAAGSEATRTLADGQPPVNNPAGPAAHVPTEAAPARTPTEVDWPGSEVPVTLTADQAGLPPQQAGHGGLPPEIVSYGPGVPAVPPAGRAELTAEHVWRNTRPAGPSRPFARLARISGWALTVILLAASGVLLYLRFHHVPFQVTACRDYAADGKWVRALT